MSRIWQLIRPYIEKANFFTILVIIFLMPMFRKAVPPVIGFWLLTWLLEGKFFTRFRLPQNKIAFISLLGFYILCALSLFYSENMESGFFDLEVKLTMFIFPFVIIGSNYLYKKYFHIILLQFVFANLIASLACLIIAINSSFHFGNNGLEFNPMVYVTDPGLEGYSNAFFYFVFSKFMHSSYFAMYLCFSILILFFFIDNYSKKWIKYTAIALIIFFLFIIYLLSSRAGLISAAVVLLGSIIGYLRNKKWTFNILLLAITLIFAIVALKFNGRLNYGVEQIKNTSVNKEEKTISTSNDRLLMWINSWEIIKANFLVGTGVGDVKDELIKSYPKHELTDAKKHALNAHNQFIETAIAIGLIGLIFLLMIFFLPFINALKNKDTLLALLIIVLGINFLFESMLNTQAGVIFFAFFYSLLVFIPKEERGNLTEKS